MPLTEGAELGPYKIKSLIGKGGMGEVYLAHDPRLDRDIAIKVSHARFTERFERAGRRFFDIAPDGKRFAVFPRVEGREQQSHVQVTFLLNFFDEVRRRIPLN